MERSKALDIWDAIFGPNTKWAYDCFGFRMCRDDYGDTEKKRLSPDGDGRQYYYGWEIDHIRPKSDFDNESDADLNNNYEPMHWQDNREKADSFPRFTINGKQYQIVKCDICGKQGLKGYGIIHETGKRVDWKGKSGKYFIKN